MIYTLGAVETRFAEIIWANEPLQSGALVKLCEKELHWKKPTTYTVLRKLCEKGLFRNNSGEVTAVMKRDDYYAAQSENFVAETFGGSLPAFVAAFAKRKNLSQKEIEELRNIIDGVTEG